MLTPMKLRLVLSFVWLLISSAAVFAQTAQLSGRVTDPSQAVIVNATVLVTNLETGIKREVKTNEDGYFTAPLLTRGNYRIEVRQGGFKGAIRDNIALDEGAAVRSDFVLEIGAVSDSVEVSGAAPLLETDRPTLSTVITNQKILDLPTAGRNPLQFALLVPGVRAVGLFGDLPVSAFDGSRASIGGGSPSGNNYMVDGIAAENFTSGGLQTPLSVDATEEFRIIVRNPSAEYGRTGGGIINLISKSGTNEFHGSVYEFHRNENINANDFFSNRAGRPKNPLVFNQYGATVGGPIKKDKTFFFFNWERFTDRRLTRAFRTVPTSLERNGDFSQTRDNQNRPVEIFNPFTTRPNPANPANRLRDQFPNNIIPASLVSPSARAIMRYYPAANTQGAAFTNANNFLGEGSAPQTKNIYGIRTDHYFTPLRRLAGRYTYDWTFRGSANLFDNVGEISNSDLPFRRDSAMLNYSDALKPNLLLELRTGLNRYAANRVPRSLGFDFTEIGLPARINSQVQMRAFPTIRPADIAGLGTGADDALIQANYAYSYVGALTWIRGKQTIKMGSENRVYQLNNTQISGADVLSLNFNRAYTQGPDPNRVASNVGYGAASLMLGTPASGNIGRWATSTYTAKNYALYIQDDWKLRPNLTVNLGLRWEREGGITDRYNAFSNFDPSLRTTVQGVQLNGGLVFPGVNGVPRGHRDGEWTDWQPRLGLAWSIRPRTVLRAGYGISFLPTTGSVVTWDRSGFAVNTPMLASVDGGFTPNETLSNPFTQPIVEPTGSRLGALTNLGLGVGGNLRTLKRGYSQQWNFNVQQELPGKWVVELGYMGNRGVSLPASRAFDYLPQQFLSLGTGLQQQVDNPFRGIIATGTLSQPRVQQSQLLDRYPQFGGANGLDSWADSVYHAATVRIEKRFSQGLSTIISYTFSKLIDNNLGNGANAFFDGGNNGVQNWDNLRAERSVSANDLPQRLVISASYELPFGKDGGRLKKSLIGGWQFNTILSAQSGNVIGVTAPAPAFTGNRPNQIGNATPANQNVDRWLDPAAFQQIPQFTFGNAPRNLTQTRTDGLFQMDLSMLKTIPIKERIRFQFRIEAFNFTNTPTFGNPGSSFTTAQFGVINGLATNTNPRVVQLAGKIYF
jgi:outer membrane receptor protein involved in Fe transport